MLAPFLIGLVGGQRAMTALATVSVAAARGGLQADTGAPPIIADPRVAAATFALAAAEMAGDKMKTAPDRTVPIGLIARFIASAIAGAALSPYRQRWLGAAVAGSTAVAASYPGWYVRMASIRRYGRASSGLFEDGLVVTGAVTVMRKCRRQSFRRPLRR